MNAPRALFWLGPGADDDELTRHLVAAGRGQILDPERSEEIVSQGDLRDGPRLTEAIRGLVLRDTRIVGATARRNLRALLGPEGVVFQFIREPVDALNRELRRQQTIGIARRWTSPGNAGSTELQVTDRMTAERVLPRLAYQRRGARLHTQPWQTLRPGPR